jgi:hypothetical protein
MENLDKGFVKLLKYLSQVRKTNKPKDIKNTQLMIIKQNEQSNRNIQ